MKTRTAILNTRQAKKLIYQLSKQKNIAIRALSEIILDVPTSHPTWRIANNATKKIMAIEENLLIIFHTHNSKKNKP